MSTRSRIVIVTTSASISLACSGLVPNDNENWEPEYTNPPEPAVHVNPPPPPQVFAAQIQISETSPGQCNYVAGYVCESGEECEAPVESIEPCPPTQMTAIGRTTSGCEATQEFLCPVDTDCGPAATIPVPCPGNLSDCVDEADCPQVHQHEPYGCVLIVDGQVKGVVECPPGLENPLDEGWTIREQSDGHCLAFNNDAGCPQGATCNPPPPVEIVCPPVEMLPSPRTNPPPGPSGGG